MTWISVAKEISSIKILFMQRRNKISEFVKSIEDVDWRQYNREIALQYGLSTAHVWIIRECFGIPDREELVRLWFRENKETLTGLPLREIARLLPFKLKPNSLKRYIAIEGIKTLSHQIRNPFSSIEKLRSYCRVDDRGCWNWGLRLLPGGYGVCKNRYVHQVAYELKHGAGSRGDKWVLHTCDNPSCANPEHLYLGDAKANAEDRVNRGRNRAALTEEEIDSIRKKLNDGESKTAIAKAMATTYITIDRLLKGKTHKEKAA